MEIPNYVQMYLKKYSKLTVNSYAFSPDNKHLVIGLSDDFLVCLVDLNTRDIKTIVVGTMDHEIWGKVDVKWKDNETFITKDNYGNIDYMNLDEIK